MTSRIKWRAKRGLFDGELGGWPLTYLATRGAYAMSIRPAGKEWRWCVTYIAPGASSFGAPEIGGGIVESRAAAMWLCAVVADADAAARA